MFWLKWAGKNIISNPKRALEKALFITLALTVVLMGLMFLEGTNAQMKEALRNNRGDLVAYARGVDMNVMPVYQEFARHHAGLLEANLRFYEEYVELLGRGGYAGGLVSGAEPAFLPYLHQTVGWQERPEEDLREGTALVESSLAGRLQVNKGDYLTIRARTEEGMLNTLTVVVDGIFLGSQLIYENMMYINIKDQELLFMTQDHANWVRAYFKPQVSDDELITVVQELSRRFFRTALFTAFRLDPTQDFIFQEFQYYRLLVVLLFTIVNLVFFVILYFAVQNSFFLSYRARRQEISTLLTYGMKPVGVRKIAFYEAVLLFVVALALAAGASWVAIKVSGRFTITNPKIADLLTVIGGPHLRFVPVLAKLLPAIGFFFVVTLYAAYRGVNTYLQMEIREIITGV